MFYRFVKCDLPYMDSQIANSSQTAAALFHLQKQKQQQKQHQMVNQPGFQIHASSPLLNTGICCKILLDSWFKPCRLNFCNLIPRLFHLSANRRWKSLETGNLQIESDAIGEVQDYHFRDFGIFKTTTTTRVPFFEGIYRFLQLVQNQLQTWGLIMGRRWRRKWVGSFPCFFPQPPFSSLAPVFSPSQYQPLDPHKVRRPIFQSQ